MQGLGFGSFTASLIAKAGQEQELREVGGLLAIVTTDVRGTSELELPVDGPAVSARDGDGGAEVWRKASLEGSAVVITETVRRHEQPLRHSVPTAAARPRPAQRKLNDSTALRHHTTSPLLLHPTTPPSRCRAQLAGEREPLSVCTRSLQPDGRMCIDVRKHARRPSSLPSIRSPVSALRVRTRPTGAAAEFGMGCDASRATSVDPDLSLRRDENISVPPKMHTVLDRSSPHSS